MSGSVEWERALEEGIAELEALAGGREGRPTRYHARAVLIPLGQLLLAGEPAERGPYLARLARAVESQREAWTAALSEELALACAEHIHSVDPRHLEHPRFDFGYVVSARARLEARLRAAAALGVAPSPVLRERVAEADRLLEAHQPRRGPGDPGRAG
jgi:hypothetical protein